MRKLTRLLGALRFIWNETYIRWAYRVETGGVSEDEKGRGELMTAKEKRSAAVALMKQLRGRNTYSQAANKRGRVFATPGYGDCSSTVDAVMKRVLGYGIGSRTTNQIANTGKCKSVIVDLKISKTGVPDISKLLPGDCLYFAGNDESRRSYKYVGHVEMVVAKNTLCGHGSGKGPTAKNLTSYCKARQRGKAPTRRGNRGLVCVRRWIFDD